MDVRQVRPTDAPLVLSLALDDGSHLVKSRDWPTANPVTHSLIHTVLPVPVAGRSWIARDGSSIALLEAQPRQYVIAWDVTRLAVRGDRDAVLGPVVRAATGYLQSRGVPRLFARCQGDAREALQSVGFQTLACEFILWGPKGGARGDVPLPEDSRYRMPPDAWPLHQLELKLTPALIRQVAGLTSLDWSQRAKDMTEIVVEKEGRIVAWVGWGAKVRSGLVQIGMLLDPQYKELGPDLLHHALRTLSPESRFVARVRDYHVEAVRAYEEADFQCVAEEILMVKHAGMELAPTAKRRMRIASVPSIQSFPIRLGVACPATSPSVEVDGS